MDIFSTIEGLKQETLSSALLRYLLINSLEVRENFISLLSDHSPLGPIESRSDFSCKTEYETSDETLGNGRLDILIQLDDVVIGIENKFWANFQENQPEKYIDSLKQVCKSQSDINRLEVDWIMFILCPESRVDEAKKLLPNLQNKSAIITWEAVLNLCESTNNISHPTAKVINDEFVNFLASQFSFIQKFSSKLPHLNGKFPDYGTGSHYDMVAALWRFFPEAGARLSNGKTWVGYYFHTENKNHSGWFGFVSKSEIRGATDNMAEFVIACTYPAEVSAGFKKVEMRSPNFIYSPGKTHAWVVEFNEDWGKIDIWREKLVPFSKCPG